VFWEHDGQFVREPGSRRPLQLCESESTAYLFCAVCLTEARQPSGQWPHQLVDTVIDLSGAGEAGRSLFAWSLWAHRKSPTLACVLLYCVIMAGRRLPLLETTAARGSLMTLDNEVRPQDQQYRPRYAVWELTLRCDLACHHCGSRAGRARPDELTLTEALQLVEQLADLGVREVTLIGGEAYLYPGWLEVVRAIRARDMVCTMTSGGRGIDTELAQAAAGAGLCSVSISLDGLELVHDELRGVQGAYASARRAFSALKQAHIPVAMNTHINRRNVDQLEDIFEIAVTEACHGWQVFLTVPMGRAADVPDLLLQPHDLLDVMPRLERLHQRAQTAGIRLLPGNNIGYFGPSERRLRGQLRPAAKGSCSAGRSALGIEANGDIKPCPSLHSADWVGGNVRQHALRAIWERSTEMRALRDRTVDDLWGFCRTCYYAEQCKAGCSWMSSSFFGRPGNNPYCHHRVLDFEARGLMERMVPLRAAPGEAFDHGEWTIEIESLKRDVAQS